MTTWTGRMSACVLALGAVAAAHRRGQRRIVCQSGILISQRGGVDLAEEVF